MSSERNPFHHKGAITCKRHDWEQEVTEPSFIRGAGMRVRLLMHKGVWGLYHQPFQIHLRFSIANMRWSKLKSRCQNSVSETEICVDKTVNHFSLLSQKMHSVTTFSKTHELCSFMLHHLQNTTHLPNANTVFKTVKNTFKTEWWQLPCISAVTILKYRENLGSNAIKLQEIWDRLLENNITFGNVNSVQCWFAVTQTTPWPLQSREAHYFSAWPA